MPMVTFEPTDQQREDVAALTSAGAMSLEAIAKTVINPRTGRSISVKTLNRIFKQELAENTKLQVLALKNLREFLEKKDWQATRYVCDHVVGLKEKERDAAKPVQDEIHNINVTFRGSPFVDEPPPEPFLEHRPLIDPPPSLKLLPAWDKEDAQLREAATPSATPATNNGPTEPTFKKHEVEPDFAPWPLKEPIPVTGPYRTELDDPANREALKPWHKRKLTGRLRQGPIMGAKKRKLDGLNRAGNKSVRNFNLPEEISKGHQKNCLRYFVNRPTDRKPKIINLVATIAAWVVEARNPDRNGTSLLEINTSKKMH